MFSILKHGKRTVSHPFSSSFACFHDYVRSSIGQGRTMRIPLNSPKVIGVASSRGSRGYQEDSHTVTVIQLDPKELSHNLQKAHGINWSPSPSDNGHAGQVLFVGIYDGHGGAAVSQHLQQDLHVRFENAVSKDIPEVVEWVKGFGGYFRRFRGGVLADWVEKPSAPLDLEARATLAFLEADREVSLRPSTYKCGATASVALLQSLDSPSTPFFASKQLALTVAHCGDTRVILGSTDSGKAMTMTENHHAEARGETARLRRMGTGLVTDSFGEARWMGALANTRGLGDTQFKQFGVTPEPEVRARILNGSEWAYMILVSDGVSSMLSDEEISGLARGRLDPQRAAEHVLSFAEELGAEDNGTVIVVPLAGWGKITGPDKTKDLREFRRRQSEGSNRQRRM